MKNLLGSTLAAFLLFGATTVSQAQPSDSPISGSFVSSTFFGAYDGSFYSRTLPFDSFSLAAYPNGFASGYLIRHYSGEGNRDYPSSTYFSGTVNKRGEFSGRFCYQRKNYTLKGTVNRTTKLAILIPSPRGSTAKLGVMIGTFSDQDFAPRSPALGVRLALSGLVDNFYINFFNDGTFNVGGGGKDRGTYGYVKMHQNLARITLRFNNGDSVTLFAFFYDRNAGIIYDTGSGLFYYFSEDSGE